MKIIGWIMSVLGSLLSIFFTIVVLIYVILTITGTYDNTIEYNETLKNFFIIGISIILDILSLLFFVFIGIILIED